MDGRAYRLSQVASQWSALHVVVGAPGNGASIGGLKVVAPSGWFAARPSGTENIYKLYAESLKDETHLEAIIAAAQEILGTVLGLGS